MKFKPLQCCDCDAEIYQLDDYYEINGKVFCEDCGLDELNWIYKKVADFPDAMYEQAYEEFREGRGT